MLNIYRVYCAGKLVATFSAISKSSAITSAFNMIGTPASSLNQFTAEKM